VNAYLPHDSDIVSLLILILLGLVPVGFAITRLSSLRIARLLSWALTIAGTMAVERISNQEPAGLRMLVIIVAALWGMKAVVAVESRAGGHSTLALWQYVAFSVAWPGMRPHLFAQLGRPPLTGAGRLIWSGARNILAGLGLMVLAWGIGSREATAVSQCISQALATLPLLVGLSLVLHFGLFNVAAGGWRLAEVDARPLFRAPLEAKSLTEFWGRRWNLAFSEMTALAIYRPLSNALGRRGAMRAAFVASGLVHELAISVPVKAGYGLPLLYFLFHGVLVLMEDTLERTGRPISRLGWIARLWTLGCLALPLPLLFHPPFLRGVVWPLIGM
jgi:alginate O-acetyltransferase complex protein AlgI